MSNKMSVSTVINEGGREGVSRSLNGDFEVKTSGTNKKGYTNPEELFAAGFSACFNGAIQFPLDRDGLGDRDRSIRAEVTLYGDLPDDHTTLHLEVTIIGKIDGVSKEDTVKYLQETDSICPYSKAVNGNIDVKYEAAE
ncbi:Ohr family peroxiredoxin [Tetragenococcus halophilus]|uniref:Ohr family peroxiredoxin n=1 Tax=Tetragenococcus halophilus TaxID=51669 RepID=UPI00077C6FBF|nr:Ohr family peroxiredoxin [Tetragenococcus halophilus]AOF48022.1 organic hydroperoxide resistance protein [Tetragenococcus halophilus]MCO7025922.1 Ohr family peroxiredoxin [Tetragenococcus halophilus]MCO8284263.1 Ohr family peroxiredoxin [Tetragenococcus halophilus]MCO8287359.1 Ohr family peroxiredoxin [Tetragenococcus halophilus]MCT8311187.1 Ohr family peroxiredoxin [Tetragenococcus halophilus]